MTRILYKIRFILGAMLLVGISIIIVDICGKSYTFTHHNLRYYSEYNDSIAKNLRVYPENDGGNYVQVTDYHVNSNKDLIITIKSKPENIKKTQRVFLIVTDNRDYSNFIILFVHKSGVITIDDYFGKTGGSKIVSILFVIYLLLIILHFIRRYRTSMKANIYQYRNILYLGFTIYLLYALYTFGNGIFKDAGLINHFYNYSDSMVTFSLITFPIIIVLTVVVCSSNVKLMKKEGKNWRNMLGFILGIALCLGIIVPEFINETLQSTNFLDLHKWTGTGRFIIEFFHLISASIMTYIECILFATIIISIKASKHIPSKDMDYILILGCMINKDGTLTKLLKGRADRAIEYSAIQKARSDKDIVFVPSGGQGSDEIMAEGDAIKNYLLSEGIDDSHILVENKSTNTDQNFALSYELIKEHYYKTHDKESKPNIAFSTTNYHVFRSGMLASSKGITTEGVGAKTVSYFWINAFIREFIATLVAEKKVHILVIGTLTAANAFSIIFTYISNVILSSPM